MGRLAIGSASGISKCIPGPWNAEIFQLSPIEAKEDRPVQVIDSDVGIEIALDAIYSDRLAVLCGAGLSMPGPSCLPSARDLAAEAKRRYEARYGATRDPLPEEISDQAEFFFQRDELATVYLRSFIDSHAFASQPNEGHYAAADLLLVQAIRAAVSTNVDTLIETAGRMLFGEISVAIDRNGVGALPADTSPLLKIHGCWVQDRDNTVWAPSQLEVDPVASRITSTKEWLRNKLLDRDLLIVGYFTDWDYLNDMLERTLGEVRPARVIVVDPGESNWLAEKAPALHALGDRATSAFSHVRVSGSEFLNSLRLAFSRGFVRRILHAGSEAYETVTGKVVPPEWKEPWDADGDTLWRLRRDMEGCGPNAPAQARIPPNEPLLGMTLIQLQARGAKPEGPYLSVDGRRIRVLRTPNQLLHVVQTEHTRATPPVISPDVVIAVGAESFGLPANVARSTTTEGSITRGDGSLWLTRNEAIGEFGL